MYDDIDTCTVCRQSYLGADGYLCDLCGDWFCDDCWTGVYFEFSIICNQCGAEYLKPRAPITSKTQMYELLRAGKLGNTLRVWDTPEDVLRSDYRGNLSLRCLAKKVPFRHNMPFDKAIEEYKKPYCGCQPSQFILCEPAPDEFVRFQAEVRDTPESFLLTWSTSKSNHRIAMKLAHHEQGRAARATLHRFMYDEDIAHIEELWELYPNHVIEFGVYSEKVGIFSKNLIIWEVRLY